MMSNRETDLYDKACETAVLAAQAAGDLIRKAAGSLVPSAIRNKGVHDLVTDVDEESQRLIISIIQADFPDHEFLAEEGSGPTASDVDGAEFLWIIDPIDGTTNFTRGVPPYAVSIGFQHRGEMVVGVVLDVPGNELFSAVTGKGLFVNGVRAQVRETRELSNGLVTTGFPYRAYGHIDVYLDVLKIFMKTTLGLRRPGSAAVDLAWVASGRFDGFFETGLMPWDVAAGIVLVREGGGRISDYSGDPKPAMGAQIVASNGHVHEEMLKILAPMRNVFD